ncbi:MAG: transcriptional regulator [Rubrivivax sp.]|nr:MAG: transcriptional regulator [Rubrivivax sp.]
MFSRNHIQMSESLMDLIQRSAREDGIRDSEVMIRALAMYFTFRQEVRSGLVLGLIDPEHQHQLKQAFDVF